METTGERGAVTVRKFRRRQDTIAHAVRRSVQGHLQLDEEITVDCFAGGGGASTGTEAALGRYVDIAINHNPVALAMHEANHPFTKHFVEDVRDVDPVVVCEGRRVGYLHLSPDCTHHSQAAGGQPRSKEIRGLSWQALKWAGTVAPRVITVENVRQLRAWGPLVAKRCKHTGRVMRLDGSVAAPGERVPVRDQFLVPDAQRAGRTWRRFISALEDLGYVVDHRLLCAADYGAPTSRERLFVVARRDGLPIVWPAPTHAKNPGPGQKKWRAAAECIDWTIPARSIFLSKDQGRAVGVKRPLADATLRRIAKGIQRYVTNAADPFIVPVTHQGGDRVHDIREPLRTVTGANRGELAVADPIIVPIAHYSGRDSVHSGREPLRTIVSATKGGEFAVAAPVLAKFRGASTGASLREPLPTVTAGGACKRPAGAAHAMGVMSPILVQAAHGDGRPDGVKRWGMGAKDVADPLGTITASGGHSVACAYLAQMNGGFNTTPGHPLDEPSTTITNRGSQQQLVTANLVTLRNNCSGADAVAPLGTVTASGEHHGLVQCTLSPENEEAALRVAAFLAKYGEGGESIGHNQPATALSAGDRLALVTVMVRGTPYVIVDITLRMLDPRELYLCQGFPANYIIDRGADGRKLSKSQQVHMCGNSVPPVLHQAIVAANCGDLAVRRAA